MSAEIGCAGRRCGLPESVVAATCISLLLIPTQSVRPGNPARSPHPQATSASPPFCLPPALQVEDGVEYLKQKGLVGAARDAADEVLARVGEAKAAVLHAPAVLLQKVRGRAVASLPCGVLTVRLLPCHASGAPVGATGALAVSRHN